MRSYKPHQNLGAVLTTVVSAVTESDIPFFAFLLVSDQPDLQYLCASHVIIRLS